MTMTWDGGEPPEPLKISALGWVRVIARGVMIVLTILLGLALLLPLRLIERPLFGMARPWTPWITQAVCRISLFWMGMGFARKGAPMRGQGAVVANHSSWLDIFVLNASDRVCFVSKSEVSGWPGIGFLARAVGTVFIARDRREAQAQTALFEDRLQAGHRLLFFPEGTSTDGLRVLPFKSTLFAAFFRHELRATLSVQPVSVTYHAPAGQDPRAYGWWGDMDFGAHLLSTLALPRQGRVEVVYHPALSVAQASDRKALAAEAEALVRAGHGLATARVGASEQV
ncbi:lysophospholipid acyltransferase family protein [Tateyamaria sp. SN3-11]|uniref:lysophospholipid acyltransferase family protein n=1 Tax=Tateyamaria sp. SN3-11 TaxID=3092147 RepID=UPI0039E79301